MPAPLSTYSLDFNAIRIALVNAVKTATGLECILEEPVLQGAPRPALPYMSFKITTPAYKTGDDDARVVSGTTYNVGGQRRMTVSFHSYAVEHEDAYNYMGLLQSSFETQSIQEVLRRAGVAVWVIGTVADLSQLLNTGYESRAQMDVTFGIAANITEDLGEIDTVEVTGTITTDQGTQVVKNFTVEE